MTFTGLFFLLLFLIILITLVKFAVKLASVFVTVLVLFALACWLYPPLYDSAKPALNRLMPFLVDGAHDAADTAKEIPKTWDRR